MFSRIIGTLHCIVVECSKMFCSRIFFDFLDTLSLNPLCVYVYLPPSLGIGPLLVQLCLGLQEELN